MIYTNKYKTTKIVEPSGNRIAGGARSSWWDRSGGRGEKICEEVVSVALTYFRVLLSLSGLKNRALLVIFSTKGTSKYAIELS